MYTPGAWTAYQKQGTRGEPLPQWRIHGPGVSGDIATVDFDLTQPTVKKQHANAAANAHLIAAAPALLEVLTALHEHCRANDAAYRNGLNNTDTLYTIVAHTIANAEGRI